MLYYLCSSRPYTFFFFSFTQTPGASASLTFSGGAIAVYGTVSPDHADIVITVDGQTHTLPGGASGFANMVHPQVPRTT